MEIECETSGAAGSIFSFSSAVTRCCVHQEAESS